MMKFRGEDLTHTIAEEIFIGHLQDTPTAEQISSGSRVDLLGTSADQAWRLSILFTFSIPKYLM